ncbi:MAG: hypothetical protein QM731_26855 [Chitinophagaceae bacterium]
MKKLMLISLLILTSARLLMAQPAGNNAAYVSAIEAQLKVLDTATSGATLTSLADKFEQIGQGWEAYYYAAYCNITLLNTIADRSTTDPIIDKAEKQIKQAATLSPDNAEIAIVQAMVIYSRVLVNPTDRWTSLNEGDSYLAKAKKLDPANPRPYVIEARVKANTPEMLGGGVDAAKTALDSCFAKLKTFQPANSIAPRWGEGLAKRLKEKIAQL